MPPKSLKLIKKGLNPPVQDNKTFNSLFKEALNSPEHFLCNNLSISNSLQILISLLVLLKQSNLRHGSILLVVKIIGREIKGLCHLLPTTIMNKYLATQKAGLFGRIILQLLSAGKI